MLKKVKKWLGIEGVKIAIETKQPIELNSGKVEGKLLFESRQFSEVSNITLRLMERYARGRGSEKLIDEYELGQVVLPHVIEVAEDEIVELDFKLPFSPLLSEMDKVQRKNILFRGMIKSAKWLRGVKSTYRIEVAVDVKGMAVSPLVKKEIDIRP